MVGRENKKSKGVKSTIKLVRRGKMGKRVKKFEDLKVWKESIRLAIDIYKTLVDARDFGLRDQLQRSAVSVPSNIAEGFERQSNKEFIQHLYIAKGSIGELRTQLYIAIETALIEEATGNEFIEQTQKIAAMLFNLIKTRKERFT